MHCWWHFDEMTKSNICVNSAARCCSWGNHNCKVTKLNWDGKCIFGSVALDYIIAGSGVHFWQCKVCSGFTVQGSQWLLLSEWQLNCSFFFYFQPANDLHVQEKDESEIFSQEVHKITTVRQYFGWKFGFKTEFRNGFVIVMIVTSVILIPWENLVMLKRWICWFFKILLSSNKYFMVPLNCVILWLQ